MSQPICDCGHEKRDHVFPSVIGKGYGSCKVCLCNAYARKSDAPTATVLPAPSLPPGRSLL